MRQEAGDKQVFVVIQLFKINLEPTVVTYSNTLLLCDYWRDRQKREGMKDAGLLVEVHDLHITAVLLHEGADAVVEELPDLQQRGAALRVRARSELITVDDLDWFPACAKKSYEENPNSGQNVLH